MILPHNPLDRLWTDRPAEPLGAVVIQNVAQAGTLAKDKIATIAADLAKKNAAAVLIADPSSIAWIFNIRGADVPHTPIRLPVPSSMQTARPSCSLISARPASSRRPILRRYACNCRRLRSTNGLRPCRRMAAGL
ncbi:hypothetical protein AJ87_32555 [Rhizobium yanglingense]|nr:hypothetical protein AJ87_32555 [Rhizobium yanglingense]